MSQLKSRINIQELGMQSLQTASPAPDFVFTLHIVPKSPLILHSLSKIHIPLYFGFQLKVILLTAAVEIPSESATCFCVIPNSLRFS